LLLRGMSAASRRALAQAMLDEPRVYLASDVDPLTGRGDPTVICAHGVVTLVNPGKRSVPEQLELTFRPGQLPAQLVRVTRGRTTLPMSAGRHGTDVSINLQPGTTKVDISVETAGVRCQSTPNRGLPSISAQFGAYELPAGR
jgi:hypothetical protein